MWASRNSTCQQEHGLKRNRLVYAQRRGFATISFAGNESFESVENPHNCGLFPPANREFVFADSPLYVCCHRRRRQEEPSDGDREEERRDDYNAKSIHVLPHASDVTLRYLVYGTDVMRQPLVRKPR